MWSDINLFLFLLGLKACSLSPLSISPSFCLPFHSIPSLSLQLWQRMISSPILSCVPRLPWPRAAVWRGWGLGGDLREMDLIWITRAETPAVCMCRQLGFSVCVCMHMCVEEMVGGNKNAGLEKCELFWIRTSGVQFWDVHAAACVCNNSDIDFYTFFWFICVLLPAYVYLSLVSKFVCTLALFFSKSGRVFAFWRGSKGGGVGLLESSSVLLPVPLPSCPPPRFGHLSDFLKVWFKEKVFSHLEFYCTMFAQSIWRIFSPVRKAQSKANLEIVLISDAYFTRGLQKRVAHF